jgi:hypothetical protein
VKNPRRLERVGREGAIGRELARQLVPWGNGGARLRSPLPQQLEHVRDPHSAIAIHILRTLGAVAARAPTPEQDDQISNAHVPVAIQVARMNWL